MSETSLQGRPTAALIAVCQFGVNGDIMSHDPSMSWTTARDEFRRIATHLPFSYLVTIRRTFGANDRVVACVVFGGSVRPDDPSFAEFVKTFLTSAKETAGICKRSDKIRSVGIALPPNVTDDELMDHFRREFMLRSSAGNA